LSQPERFRLQHRPLRPELVVIIVILAMGSVALWFSNIRLNRALREESARLEGLADLVEEAERRSFSRADFDVARGELEQVLSETELRVRTLEAAADARERVIAKASESIVFVQGSYGFVEPESGRPLRHFYGRGGRPLRLPDGMTMVTTGGDGPIVQILYTGTAFVVSGDGLMMTNHHVAEPWEFEENAQFTLRAGFAADRRRLVGFLPGLDEPIDLEIVATGDGADLAVLRFVTPTALPPALEISDEVPHPGDEIVVMGYPAGVEALLARADPNFAEGLLASGPVSFWDVGRALAVGGYIRPLSTQGIIGQVTDAMIVYDAGTTRGGSGGPVLGLDGKVLAVNSAVLSRFAGSNLGVPAAAVRRLLASLADGASR
jgi:S1-C subfamily serine protease